MYVTFFPHSLALRPPIIFFAPQLLNSWPSFTQSHILSKGPWTVAHFFLCLISKSPLNASQEFYPSGKFSPTPSFFSHGFAVVPRPSPPPQRCRPSPPPPLSQLNPFYVSHIGPALLPLPRSLVFAGSTKCFPWIAYPFFSPSLMTCVSFQSVLLCMTDHGPIPHCNLLGRTPHFFPPKIRMCNCLQSRSSFPQPFDLISSNFPNLRFAIFQRAFRFLGFSWVQPLSVPPSRLTIPFPPNFCVPLSWAIVTLRGFSRCPPLLCESWHPIPPFPYGSSLCSGFFRSCAGGFKSPRSPLWSRYITGFLLLSLIAFCSQCLSPSVFLPTHVAFPVSILDPVKRTSLALYVGLPFFPCMHGSHLKPLNPPICTSAVLPPSFPRFRSSFPLLFCCLFFPSIVSIPFQPRFSVVFFLPQMLCGWWYQPYTFLFFGSLPVFSLSLLDVPKLHVPPPGYEHPAFSNISPMLTSTSKEFSLWLALSELFPFHPIPLTPQYYTRNTLEYSPPPPCG